jgi:hypothetical protein
MKNLIKKCAEELYRKLENELITESIISIKNQNGNSNDSPRACKAGSSIYILCDKNNEILYVGETGKSIKTRCFGDGNGAHCKKMNWFNNVSNVKHFTKNNEDELSEKERKLIEQAFSIYLKPRYYLGKNKS